MALDYSTENMGMSKTLFEGSCEQAVDCDISLPDYCPDISRVLKCCVIPSLASAKISGDRACADGNALVRIIYADENNNICTYEQNFPFSKFVQIGADNSGILNANVNTQYTNCRAVSKRRLDIHALIQILFKVSGVAQCETIQKIDKESVQTQAEDISFSNLCAAESKFFCVGETIELPADYLPAERIIACCGEPVLSDIRVVQDKILIKGEIDIAIVYCPTDNNGESVKFCHTIPVNQVVEVAGIKENSTPAVTLKNMGCECSVRNDTSSNPRLIEVNCNIIADIKAFVETRFKCITDAYCIDGQLHAKYEEREYLCLSDTIRETAMQKFTVDLSSLDGQKICCLWWDEPKVNKDVHDGNMSLHTTVPVNIIALDSDGRPVFCEREIDFEFKKSVDAQACKVCGESVTPIGFSSGTIIDGKAEIKGEFFVCANVFTCKKINTLIDADITPCEHNATACVVVYFPDKNEKLWNIARKFNTTVDMIKGQNSLSDEFAKVGEPLLIPVKGH